MKLPKQIYVRWEHDGVGEPYLMCCKDAESCADSNDTVKVGVYKLVEKGEVVNATTYQKRKG